MVRQIKRVSKAEWLQASLKLLEDEGVEAVRVGRIARKLGIARSGFYWHFKSRDDLRNQILEYWAHEFTEVVTDNPSLRELDPRERLEQMMVMILEHELARYEVEMRSWAKSDPGIARRVRQVYRMRLDYLRETFREMGFEGEDLEMRTRMFVCYHMWESSMFDKESKKSLRKLIRSRVALLTQEVKRESA